VSFAAVVLARVAYDPRLSAMPSGTTPIFNWLLYGYGCPRCGLGRQKLTAAPAGRRQVVSSVESADHHVHRADTPFLEIRHLITTDDIIGPASALAR